ncbi:MAG: alkaline phosphatase family protein [Gemmatimonadales bacterium]
MSPPAPHVLLIALDAAEPTLVEQWMADGSLPALRALRERGGYGRLASSADWLAGSPWPTFYTGTPPGDHGFYHHLGWHAARMQTVRPTPDALPLTPFWRAFGRHGPRAVVLDVPMTYQAQPFNGVEIAGWATHDGLVPPSAFPAEVMRWVGREIGPSPARYEEYVPLPARRLLEIRDEQIRATGLVADLATALLGREPCDLFIAALGATHRGGHQLWDETGLKREPSPDERMALRDALRQVYAPCDAAVGRIAAAAGEPALLLVCSLHGMGPNTSRLDVLPEMLHRILAGGSSSGAKRSSVLHRVRGLVPNQWRHALKNRLPLAIQDRLTAFWRIGGSDWSRTRAFCPLADLQGYIRINLAGREAAGVVKPGSECDALVREITDGLESFTDVESGERVVRDVVRSDALYPGGGRVSELPDLLVRWAASPAAEQRAITSARFGTIAMPSPGTNPTGRSGNHRPEGFLIAVGSGFAPGATIEGGHILDLAPTVHAALGLPTPDGMRGRDLRSATAPNGPPVRDR